MAKECKREIPKKMKRTDLSVKARGKRFNLHGEGLIQEEAIQEAKRCLGLRECEACDLCSLLCPDLCITRDEKTGEVLIDLNYCKGCGICAAVCPKGAIQMVMEEGR